MAATPKHRRSSRRRRTTQASNRYDVVLNKARKMKKNGGSLSKSPSHMVTPENPTYKGVTVITKTK
jgi:hypothetical protein